MRLLAKPKTERPGSAEEVLGEVEHAAVELAGGPTTSAVRSAGRSVDVEDSSQMEPQVRFCTSADGTRIAYGTLGEGPPLVVISTWGRNMELDWELPEGRTYMEGLGEGRMIVCPTQRGGGASQRLQGRYLKVATLLPIKDAAEDGRAIESWETAPVDGAGFRDQGAGLHVTDQSVIADWGIRFRVCHRRCHVRGAMSSSASGGPQLPAVYVQSGAGLSSTGWTTFHARSTPSSRANRVWSPSIASWRRRS